MMTIHANFLSSDHNSHADGLIEQPNCITPAPAPLVQAEEPEPNLDPYPGQSDNEVAAWLARTAAPLEPSLDTCRQYADALHGSPRDPAPDSASPEYEAWRLRLTPGQAQVLMKAERAVDAAQEPTPQADCPPAIPAAVAALEPAPVPSAPSSIAAKRAAMAARQAKSNQEFDERKRREKKEKRAARNKRYYESVIKPREEAKAVATTCNPRADLSQMTKEERQEHRNAQARECMRRKRAKNKLTQQQRDDLDLAEERAEEEKMLKLLLELKQKSQLAA